MTLSTSDSRFSYDGDASTTEFSYPRKVIEASHLKVYVYDEDDDSMTLQTLDTHYTFAGSGLSNGIYASATITFLTAPGTDKKVIIFRDPTLTNEFDFTAETNVLNALNRYSDRVEMKIQRLDDRMDRAVVLPDGDYQASLTNSYAKADWASKLLGFDASGNPQPYTNDGSSTSVTATGSTTARTLADRFAQVFRPEDFGAVGDGTTNDTAAFTALFALMDDGDAIELKPGAIYSVTNLVLPSTNNGHVSNGMYCPGGMAVIKARSGGDADYLVAYASWVTATGTSGGTNPWHFRNVIFDANSIAANAVVNESYEAQYENCHFYNATSAGCLDTRQNEDATQGVSSYLAEVRWTGCYFYNNATYGLRTQGLTGDNTDAPTDSFVDHCVFNGNSATDYGIYLANAGGWDIHSCHTYSNTVAGLRIENVDRHGAIANNTFEELVIVGDAGDFGISQIGPGNAFWTGLRYDGADDTSSEILRVFGNIFTRSGSTRAQAQLNDNARTTKTLILDHNAFEHATPYTLGASAAGRVLVYGGQSAEATEQRLRYDAPNLFGFRNRLLNGAFSLNQRAAATNADDTYSHDRWYVLTQTDTVAVSTASNPENGQPQCARLTQSQAVAQRFGYAQIIESGNCRDLRGDVATFRGRVRLSASADVRYAILEWTGTADSVTSDVVNDWTSATYTGGNFFNSTTLNVLKVAEVACTANTWRDLTAITATVGSSATNLILLVWTEGTAAQNVTLDLGRMQLERGSSASDFELRPSQVELAACQRYCERINATAAYTNFLVGQAISTTAARGTLRWAVTKRQAPTVTIGNATSFACDRAGSAQEACATVTVQHQTADSVEINATVSANLVAGNATVIRANNSTDPYILAEAEL